jgi:hypothetical protein
VYTVYFTRKARDELAQAWLDADSAGRSAVSQASDALERDLRRRPLEVGESREDSRRIGFEGPLRVLFDVSEADREVVVLHVWCVRRPDA